MEFLRKAHVETSAEEDDVTRLEGYTAKIPKEGDLSEGRNYTGIMLLSVCGKVLNRILLDRMRVAVDSLLGEEQAEFGKVRSCIN